MSLLIGPRAVIFCAPYGIAPVVMYHNEKSIMESKMLQLYSFSLASFAVFAMLRKGNEEYSK